MDIQQFLAEGPLGALLGLAVIPVMAALALVGYLAFAFSRRSKKGKMKLGLQPSQKEANTVPKSQETRPKPVDASPAKASRIDGDDLDMALLATADDPAPAQDFEPEPVDLSRRLAETAPSQPQAQPKASPLSASIPQPAANEPAEMLRLLRQPGSGQLVVEIAGQQFTKLAEIKDRKLGQFVLRLVGQLLAFTGGAILTEAGVKSVAAPPVTPLPEPPFVPVSRGTASLPVAKSTSTVPSPPSEMEAEFLASLAQTPGPPPPPKRGGLLGLGAKTKPAPIPAAGELFQLNLADEINNVVQKNLAHSPLAGTNQVEIISNPSGGLRILVNRQAYTSPEEIPDEAVKKLIKDSIKEWERS